MKPTICRCCGEQMEKSPGQLDSNPNMCLACAEWSDATEFSGHESPAIIAVSESEPVPAMDKLPRLPRAA